MEKTLKVLVADDNPVNLRAAVKLLRDMGHSGALANDGEKALKALDAQHFDVVLMDVNMPVMGGLEALGILRAHEAQGRAHTPVIMVTAHDDPSDRRRMLDAGADGYIAKPMSPETLQTELGRVLGR